jgi:chloramphenicol 3-O phosphotransferase
MPGDNRLSPGNIILLNGTSSSGKTTIAKALQAIMPEPYYLFGMDMLQPGFPPGVFVFNSSPSESTVEGWEIIFRNERLQEVYVGPRAVRFLSGMYRAAAAFAAAGNHIILEDVIYHRDVLRAAASELYDAPVLFVGIRLPLEIAEQREIERGNRALGGARTFFTSAHDQKIYDLEVDNSSASPEACALQIKAAIDNNHPATAIRDLWRRMNADK